MNLKFYLFCVFRLQPLEPLCMFACLSEAISFLPFTHFFCGCPYVKIKQYSFTPSYSTFGTPRTKYFFALIIFLQTLVEMIFLYHYIFGTPWDLPTNKMKTSHMSCLVSK